MKPVRFSLIILAATLMLSGCMGTRIVRKSCSDCHQKEMLKYKEGNLHKPLVDNNCEACHIPHGLIGALKLKEKDAKLCYQCHEKDRPRLEKAPLHTPLTQGICLKCHNPHSSKLKGLTRVSGNDLCYLCHAKGPFAKKTIHKAVADGCDNCHNPHSSEHGYNLLEKGNKLCEKCHDVNAVKFTDGHFNYKVAGTNCLSCHTPHSSSSDKLVREYNHGPFGQRKCSDCHNSPD